MSITDMCKRGRQLSQVSMAGLMATCGRCLLLLLVLCTSDTTTLSLPFHTRDTLPMGPHPGGGHTKGGYPPETNISPTVTSSSSSGSLHALIRMAFIVQSLHEEQEYFDVGEGGGGGEWQANRQTRAHTDSMKMKRQGFFGIDNADFVLRTLKLKNAVKTPRVVTTADDTMVARVALINAMRNRHRQRVRIRPGRLRFGLPSHMSVNTSIEDLRRLMQKQGR